MTGRLSAAIRPDVAAGRYRLALCVSSPPGAPRTCKVARTIAVRTRATSQHPCSCVQLPDHAPADGVEAPAETSVSFTAPANPVNVAPKLDTARRAAKVIGPMGGTVEATGAHGEHYILTVPESALIGDVEISVTPLASIDGLPFSGGLVAGAQMAPDGLRFTKPATLTITGAPAVAPGHETPFGYRGDGKDLALAPMARDTKTQAFPLMHFSAVGIASGTAEERRATLVRLTSDVESRLQSSLGADLALDREYQLYGTGRPLNQDKLAATFKTYYDEVLQPLLQAALTDDQLAPRAINKALAWDRQRFWMLGDDALDAESKTINQMMVKIAENAGKQAVAKCLAGDPGQLPVLLAFTRQAAFMGLDILEDVHKAFVNCATFDLSLDATIDQVGGTSSDPQPYHGHLLIAHLMLKLDGDYQVFGMGKFAYPEFSITVPPHTPGVGCWSATSGWETSGDAFAFLHLDLNWIEDVDGDQYQLQQADIADVRLDLPPLLTREEIHYADCGGSTGTGGVTTWFGTTFDKLHQAERGTTGLEIKSWERPNLSTFTLAKHYDRTMTVDNHQTTEHTVLTLRHTPQAG